MNWRPVVKHCGEELIPQSTSGLLMRGEDFATEFTPACPPTESGGAGREARSGEEKRDGWSVLLFSSARRCQKLQNDLPEESEAVSYTHLTLPTNREV